MRLRYVIKKNKSDKQYTKCYTGGRGKKVFIGEGGENDVFQKAFLKIAKKALVKQNHLGP